MSSAVEISNFIMNYIEELIRLNLMGVRTQLLKTTG